MSFRAAALTVLTVALLLPSAGVASAAPPQCFPKDETVAVDTLSELYPGCGITYPATNSAEYEITTPPDKGSVRILRELGRTVFRYLPPSGYTGPDVFSYRVATPDGVSGEVEYRLSVARAANRPPTCVTGPPLIAGQPVRAGTSTTAPLLCSDPDGDEVTPSVSTDPAHGTATIVTVPGGLPRLEVRPDGGYVGSDALTLRASDGTTTADVQIGFTVKAALGNAAPTCSKPFAGSAFRNVTATISVVCTDADGDPLTVRALSMPSHGTLGAFLPVTDNLFATHSAAYTPARDFVGDDAVTLVAEDGRGGTSAPLELPISTTAAPAASGAACDILPATVETVRSGTTQIISNRCFFTLPMAAPEIQAPPAHGTVTISGGMLRYTSAPGYTGPDAFTYRMLTAGGSSSPVTQEILVVAGANTAPVCNVELPRNPLQYTGEYVVRAGTPVAVRLTCSDREGDEVTVAADAPAAGSLDALAATGEAPGEFTTTYRPPSDIARFVTLRFRVSDGRGAGSVAEVLLAVRHAAHNAPPSCDAFFGGLMFAGVVVGSEALAEEPCGDPDGDVVALEIVDAPAGITFGAFSEERPGRLTGVVTVGVVQPGTYQYRVRPVDARGARGAWVKRNVLVAPVQAPIDQQLGGGESAGAGAAELPTPGRPAQIRVTTLDPGRVKIVTGSGSSPAGYRAFGLTFDLTAPDAIPEVPLLLRFRFDASLLTGGAGLGSVAVFRGGDLVPACTGDGATPNPCVADRRLVGGGDLEIVVRSSRAGAWSFGVAAASVPPPADVPVVNPGLRPGPGAGVAPDPPVGPQGQPGDGATPPPVTAATLTIGPLPRLRTALARGLRVGVTAPRTGRAKLRLTLDGRTAKRLKLSKGKAVTVAAASTPVRAGRRSNVTLRFTKKGRRALARAARVRLTLAVTVGGGKPVTRTITLRR